MSSGADLFVVCKQCGAEVSPYITECPYCGHRLRKRAPKLPSKRDEGSGEQRPASPLKALSNRMGQVGSGRLGSKRLGSSRVKRRSGRTGAVSGRIASAGVSKRSGFSSYATAVLVALSCASWVAFSSGYLGVGKLMIVGPVHGDWWKLFSSSFVYGSDFSSSLFAFCAILAIAIFGSLLEHRHGPIVVLLLFLGAGGLGALVAQAVYPEPIISGGNGVALALIAAWAVPDLKLARSGDWYEGDLLGVCAIAIVLLAMPFAKPEVSWLAGLVGGSFGLLVGLGLNALAPEGRY